MNPQLTKLRDLLTRTIELDKQRTPGEWKRMPFRTGETYLSYQDALFIANATKLDRPMAEELLDDLDAWEILSTHNNPGVSGIAEKRLESLLKTFAHLLE